MTSFMDHSPNDPIVNIGCAESRFIHIRMSRGIWDNLVEMPRLSIDKIKVLFFKDSLILIPRNCDFNIFGKEEKKGLKEPI